VSPRTPGFDGRYIVVADEDRAIIGLVVETLLNDGHAVFQAYDACRPSSSRSASRSVTSSSPIPGSAARPGSI